MISIEFTLPIFVQAVTLFLGGLVFFNNPKRKENIVFSLLVMSGVFWIFCVFLADLLKTYPAVLLWTRMSVVGPSLIGGLFLSFSLIFFDKRKIKWWKIVLVFILPFTIIALAPTSFNVQNVEIKEWGTDFTPGPLYYLLLVYLVAYFGLGFYYLRKTYLKAKKNIERKQISFILIGLLGALGIGLVSNLIFPVLGFAESSKYGPSLSLLFFVSLTSISILKHHLLDTKVILTEALVFLLIGILVVKIPISETFGQALFDSIILVLTIIIGGSLIKSVVSEIQRRKKIEKMADKLQKAYKELKELDSAKSEFIAMASHQLRTPLTIIKGLSSMILEGTFGRTPEKIKQPIRDIFDSNERLVGIVNDLLDISKADLGRLELSKEKMEIGEMIESVLNELKQGIKDKNLKIVWNRPKKAIEIEADLLKFRQAFFNIVDNAIKYTAKGKIEIRLKDDEKKVIIEVEDTGEGMTNKEESRVFESFTRGRAGIDRWVQGTGLGLYLARRYIELHNGKIWAESPGKGKGSTFFIEIPKNG